MPNSKEKSNDRSSSQNAAYTPRQVRKAEDRGGLPKLSSPGSTTSNTSILSMDELLEAANEVSKMTIAHEIVLNKDFKLQEVYVSPDSLEARVKETMHKAFWDTLREQLARIPPDYSHAIKLLQEIKESLLSLLLPWQSRLQSQIEEALDMELIQQEAKHGALDMRNLTTYILGTMSTLCAPVRDEEMQRLRVITDPILQFREIFRVLDLMKMDMVNFTIQTLRPHLQEHSVQYERKKFQELLDKLPDSLAHTTEWLRKAASQVGGSSTATSASSLSSSKSSVSSRPPTAKELANIQSACSQNPTAVLNQAYMDLLSWEPGREYPETMLMDKARMHAIQAQVEQLTIIPAVLLVTSNTCGRVCCSPGCTERMKHVIKALVAELPDMRLQDALLDISNQMHQEVNRILLQHGYPILSSEKVASLKGQVKNLADKKNGVRTIIAQRVQTFLRSCLTNPDQNSKDSKDLLQSLCPVQEELLEIGQKFSSLVQHNKKVFGPYYSDIMKSLAEGKVKD